MKKKQNVSISQVRKHLEVKGIDEQEFFFQKNGQNKEALSEVFHAFTGMKVSKEGVFTEHEGKNGEILMQKHQLDVERFQRVQNMEQFVEMMNTFIDLHNEAYQRSTLAHEILDNMNEEESIVRKKITVQALSHLAKINTIRKERELNIADIRRESLESFSDFNTMIKAFSIRAEKRFQELQELDNQDPKQEFER